MLPGERDGVLHVFASGAARNYRRAAIDHRIPDLACRVVFAISRRQKLSVELLSETRDNARRNCLTCPVDE